MERKYYLNEFEEIVLLTVGALQQDAYGFAITEEIERQTDRTVSISAVHTTLYRLQDKGLVDSTMGGASNKRGGRRKRIFSITAFGKQTLVQSRDTRERLWKLVPSFELKTI